MKVEQLEIPKEQAIEEYEAYKEALKKPIFEHEQYLQDLKKIYGHMKHGRSIIDLWAAMKQAGIRASGNPKLAICRAHAKKCRFKKIKGGSGVFYYEREKFRNSWDQWIQDINIPSGTFAHWEETTDKRTWNDNGVVKSYEVKEIKEQDVETIVPIIPAKFLNALRGSLKNYHILWEVKKWKPVPPIDPILLRQLTPNMFVVLATWDLTKLERAVIKGRLQ